METQIIKHHIPVPFLLLAVLIAAGCSVSNNPQREQLKGLQKGRIKDGESAMFGSIIKKGDIKLP